MKLQLLPVAVGLGRVIFGVAGGFAIAGFAALRRPPEHDA